MGMGFRSDIHVVVLFIFLCCDLIRVADIPHDIVMLLSGLVLPAAAEHNDDIIKPALQRIPVREKVNPGRVSGIHETFVEGHGKVIVAPETCHSSIGGRHLDGYPVFYSVFCEHESLIFQGLLFRSL